MNDARIDRLAKQIVFHSLRPEINQKVLVDVTGQAEPLVSRLIEEVYRAGAVPIVRTVPISNLKALLCCGSVQQLQTWAAMELRHMDEADAYIGIRADENAYELTDADRSRAKAYADFFLQPWHRKMAMKQKWVLLKYPTYGMAQLAEIGMDALKNMYFESCLLDYDKLAEWSKPVMERLNAAETVRIVSPGTDLRFSIKGMGSYFCDGRYNLPDGELFTAPIADSAEGFITFNVPSTYLGTEFTNVHLEFRAGKVQHATGRPNDRLLELLDSDEGARRIGEFGIGLNGYIRKPTNQLLFDEKMCGSIHLALGQAFPMADNGNESAIHWDLVLHQHEQYGGGELYFDGQLIRKDGLFIADDLKHLNEIDQGGTQ